MPSVRPRWWTELPLILLVYLAYTCARLLARGDVGTAVDNGLAILRLERALVINAEEPLNRLFTEYPALGVPASFLYATLHYLVTPLVLVWIFRRRPLRYRLVRTWLMISTLLGLVGFTLLPTAPPRLLGPLSGFVDSLAQYSSYGWWSDAASAPSGLGDMTNQYAAMPSLHVGWAVWCGVVVWMFGRRRVLTRMAAVGYPLITTVVVMGTANHYLLDVLGGLLVMGVGYLLAVPALRVADRIRRRAGLAPVALPPSSSLGPPWERIPEPSGAGGGRLPASGTGGAAGATDAEEASAGPGGVPVPVAPAATPLRDPATASEAVPAQSTSVHNGAAYRSARRSSPTAGEPPGSERAPR